jgi:hypothetical protein
MSDAENPIDTRTQIIQEYTKNPSAQSVVINQT